MPPDPSPLSQFPGNNPDQVPVFNCHIILNARDESGRQTGRVANLTGIEASGSSEREILVAITKRFKAFVQHHVDHGKTIPWVDPPEAAGPGEGERFVPVHL